MYKCPDCGLVCSKPYEYKDYAPVGDTIECCSSSLICPNTECRGDVAEAMACILCEEEYVFTEDRDPFCDKCKKSIVKRFVNEFSQQEYEFLYDYIECKTYDDLVKEVK